MRKVRINNKNHEVLNEQSGKYFVKPLGSDEIDLDFTKVLWDFDGEFYETFQNEVLNTKELCQYFDLSSLKNFYDYFNYNEKVIVKPKRNYFQRCWDTLKNMKSEYIYETPINDLTLGIYYEGVLFKPMSSVLTLYGDTLAFLNAYNDIIVIHIVGEKTIVYNGSLAEVKFN